jgi:hypothetical protein
MRIELVAQHDDQGAQCSHLRHALRRQASEQCFTSAQFFAQRRRQLIASPHVAQGLLGNAALLPRKLARGMFRGLGA